MAKSFNMGGILSRTQYKRSAKSPDYSGQCNINDQEYRIAGWLKDGQHGQFVSLKFTSQEEYEQYRQQHDTKDQPKEKETNMPF